MHSSIADVHQIHHPAEMMDLTCAVRDEVETGKCVQMTASQSEHFLQLSALGLQGDSVLSWTKVATVGGFYYSQNMYVILPTRRNDMPEFGLIRKVFKYEKIIIVVEETEVLLYDNVFAAFLVQPREQSLTRAFFTTALPSLQSLSPWKRYDSCNQIFLSPRRYSY